MALLQLSQVTKDFGGLKALEDVSTHVDQGEIVSLIGPNGAGKTTLFNCITGTMPPSSGSITFDGDELVGKRPHEVANRGIARTFQHIRLFNEMTIMDNVMVGRDYKGMKPTMEVDVGDEVKKGQTLFTDKKMPNVRYASPAGGKVIAVNRGAKRVFLSVAIEVAASEEEIEQAPVASSEIPGLSTEQVKAEKVSDDPADHREKPKDDNHAKHHRNCAGE